MKELKIPLLHFLGQLYGPFFDLHNWETVITSGNDWLIIFSLVLIECLLSVDNAVVLAAQTQSLPTRKQQEESLFYGIWGAYIFRFIIIGLGTYLINFWEIKIIGSLYLVFLVFQYFTKTRVKHTRKLVKDRKKRILPLFWSVVLQIEMMDIIFSVDSVLASLAISSNPVIVLIGGLIGILAMRGVAEVIMKLMRRIPELEPMAYILIGLIAVKLFISIPAIDIEIPATLFGIIVLGAIVVTLLIHVVRRRKGPSKDPSEKSNTTKS
ncbi:TerC family protein [Levilactobacillus tujiorum]|uniref:TerC family protein n=1 Tax=Levilactobacillus tujiorum TaxID=2912243 RepID=A0ABX1L8N6_9LACO|nr:TerC family protein [Levilactobacillus tujiorum]MCH5465625.1 TerC family protein [Levilactobacillus tujiorum]NLR12778.1 TerC family protein [Lactobacillus sp. HBUAS51387]NLR30619.1 TerC family protein [Levilactobacillus tujiorum]